MDASVVKYVRARYEVLSFTEISLNTLGFEKSSKITMGSNRNVKSAELERTGVGLVRKDCSEIVYSVIPARAKLFAVSNVGVPFNKSVNVASAAPEIVAVFPEYGRPTLFEN